VSFCLVDRIKRRVERGAFCHFDVEGHREGVPDGDGDKLAAFIPGKDGKNPGERGLIINPRIINGEETRLGKGLSRGDDF
jgi:hypothetical protein